MVSGANSVTHALICSVTTRLLSITGATVHTQLCNCIAPIIDFRETVWRGDPRQAW